MFYKDRTLVRTSLRKSLGSGPHVGFPLARPVGPRFTSVRAETEEDGMCVRQKLKQRLKLITVPCAGMKERRERRDQPGPGRFGSLW